MIKSLASKLRTVLQAIFAISVLLSAQAHAQSVVGSWTIQGYSGFDITFQSSGRWSLTVSDPQVAQSCGGTISVAGPYTLSGNSISLSEDSGVCGQSVSFPAQPVGSGTYSFSGSSLLVNFVAADGTVAPLTLIPRGGTSITRTTPLPPPPTSQTVFTVPTGRLPTAAVSVTPSGTFGSATLIVTLDLSKVLSGGSFAGLGQFAAGYNIYVAALAPSGALGLTRPTWFVLPASRNWAALSVPIAAYMEGLAQNATNSVTISILQGLDVTGLVGTEFYVGYGTSDTEMLQNGRYRGVYKAQ